MQHCPKCLYPVTHPFGLEFNDSFCTGCQTHNEKYSIEWAHRDLLLEEKIKSAKKKRRTYDCVVPVIGDAEDYYVVSTVLAKGLDPLVVCVNDYFKNDIGWHNLHNLITKFDVDSIVFNPDLHTYKELIRTSLRKFDHVLLPFLQLHTSFPVHVAYSRKIPLIIWGQNQAVEQVGKFSHNDRVEMSRWGRREHDLFGVEIEDLTGTGAQVSDRDLNYYRYPSIRGLGQRELSGVFLSNYMPWDPLRQNAAMVDFGFIPEHNAGSFDVYERAGSSVYYQIHDLLKLKRVGYRKISDHVAREARHGRITSDQAQNIVTHFNRRPIYLKPFFQWLGVTDSGYKWFLEHRLRSVSWCISGDETADDGELVLPDKLRSEIAEAQLAERKFLMFGKGVDI